MPESVPQGRIDMHSHLLPGIDDGCLTLEESLQCIERLQRAGYVGTICTPHVWPAQFPMITRDYVIAWTTQLRDQLKKQGVDYHIWPGGEVRLHDGIIDWLRANGVPTLGPSKCVLCDIWERKWATWINEALDWLKSEGYQPIFAHPERNTAAGKLNQNLKDLVKDGVWLQGNFRCMTGEEGYYEDQFIRELLSERKYHFPALDMHGFDDLESRLDGMQLVAAEFGEETLEEMTTHNPRKLLLGLNA